MQARSEVRKGGPLVLRPPDLCCRMYVGGNSYGSPPGAGGLAQCPFSKVCQSFLSAFISSETWIVGAPNSSKSMPVSMSRAYSWILKCTLTFKRAPPSRALTPSACFTAYVRQPDLRHYVINTFAVTQQISAVTLFLVVFMHTQDGLISVGTMVRAVPSVYNLTCGNAPWRVLFLFSTGGRHQHVLIRVPICLYRLRCVGYPEKAACFIFSRPHCYVFCLNKDCTHQSSDGCANTKKTIVRPFYGGVVVRPCF